MSAESLSFQITDCLVLSATLDQIRRCQPGYPFPYLHICIGGCYGLSPILVLAVMIFGEFCNLECFLNLVNSNLII